MKILRGCFVFFFCTFLSAEGEMRVWRAVGRFRVEAAFVEYDAGVVTLRKYDGEKITGRVERLTPRDRDEVRRLAGDQARGAIPAGQMLRPTRRQALRWSPIVRGDAWPESMPQKSKDALLNLRRSWQHAETEHFIIHFQQVTFARLVARMADFQYEYIVADLPRMEDRVEEKSHIVVLRNQDDWQEFLEKSGSAPEWAAAYVQGKIMYLQDVGNPETNADILAHEMSHLVLNRFFVRQPPLWLNEGLAEWYGNFGYAAYRGQRVNPSEGLGSLQHPLPVAALFGLGGYPGDAATVSRFYQTSQQLIGMLILRRDQPEFVRFLQAITVEGRPLLNTLSEVYGLSGVHEVQVAFDAFLN
jgi:hypothetical protein